MNPNCSEWVEHIELNYDEKIYAEKLMKKMRLDDETKEHLLEHFGCYETPMINNDYVYMPMQPTQSTQPTQVDNMFSNTGFIESDICEAYVKIRDIIKKYRLSKL